MPWFTSFNLRSGQSNSSDQLVEFGKIFNRSTQSLPQKYPGIPYLNCLCLDSQDPISSHSETLNHANHVAHISRSHRKTTIHLTNLQTEQTRTHRTPRLSKLLASRATAATTATNLCAMSRKANTANKQCVKMMSYFRLLFDSFQQPNRTTDDYDGSGNGGWTDVQILSCVTRAVSQSDAVFLRHRVGDWLASWSMKPS